MQRFIPDEVQENRSTPLQGLRGEYLAHRSRGSGERDAFWRVFSQLKDPSNIASIDEILGFVEELSSGQNRFVAAQGIIDIDHSRYADNIEPLLSRDGRKRLVTKRNEYLAQRDEQLLFRERSRLDLTQYIDANGFYKAKGRDVVVPRIVEEQMGEDGLVEAMTFVRIYVPQEQGNAEVAEQVQAKIREWYRRADEHIIRDAQGRYLILSPDTPKLSSMSHLAELQQKAREEGLPLFYIGAMTVERGTTGTPKEVAEEACIKADMAALSLPLTQGETPQSAATHYREADQSITQRIRIDHKLDERYDLR